MKYVQPISNLKSFTCPHCGVLARQYHYAKEKNMHGSYGVWEQNPVRVSLCENCDNICLWYFDQMVYPDRGNAPIPNSDMPDEIKKYYEEASSIATKSPRGAAALLRLAIQKLCIHLGGEGKNINDDIAKLVKDGLPERIKKSLDVVRVIGNNAVHPGQINTDNEEIVGNLFQLVNIITEYMISMPNRIEKLYVDLPNGAREAIKKRDNK